MHAHTAAHVPWNNFTQYKAHAHRHAVHYFYTHIYLRTYIQTCQKLEYQCSVAMYQDS